MAPNIPTLATPKTQSVNCWQCRHFATSWDPALPYMCRLMGFKSKMLPSIQIVQLDGRPCQGFDLKPQKAAPIPHHLSIYHWGRLYKFCHLSRKILSSHRTLLEFVKAFQKSAGK